MLINIPTPLFLEVNAASKASPTIASGGIVFALVWRESPAEKQCQRIVSPSDIKLHALLSLPVIRSHSRLQRGKYWEESVLGFYKPFSISESKDMSLLEIEQQNSQLLKIIKPKLDSQGNLLELKYIQKPTNTYTHVSTYHIRQIHTHLPMTMF